jgi:hypothetical protein
MSRTATLFGSAHRAAYDSTGSRAAHAAAAAAIRSPGSAEGAPERSFGPGRSAASATPRETLTSRPPPGRTPAGGAIARPAASTGSTTPPCAPIPGTRNASPGAMARIAASSAGAVAPTTRPTVPPGPHVVARRATRAQSGSVGASEAGGRPDASRLPAPRAPAPPTPATAVTSRSWNSPAPGFEVRHST